LSNYQLQFLKYGILKRYLSESVVAKADVFTVVQRPACLYGQIISIPALLAK